MNKIRSVAILLSCALVADPTTAAAFAPSAEVLACPIKIPARYGNVMDSFGLRVSGFELKKATPSNPKLATRNSKPVVVLIQDLHGNAGVQRNIAEILKHLAMSHEQRTMSFLFRMFPHCSSLMAHCSFLPVFVEGAHGPFDVSVLRQVSQKSLQRQAIDHFLNEGKLNGSEIAAIESRFPLHLWGIDDKALYWKNLLAYTEASRHSPVPHPKHPAWQRYYAVAEERNIPLTLNALAHIDLLQKTPVPPSLVGLVAGGFHTEGITHLLKAHQVPYCVISPRVKILEDEHRYAQRLRTLAVQAKAHTMPGPAMAAITTIIFVATSFSAEAKEFLSRTSSSTGFQDLIPLPFLDLLRALYWELRNGPFISIPGSLLALLSLVGATLLLVMCNLASAEIQRLPSDLYSRRDRNDYNVMSWLFGIGSALLGAFGFNYMHSLGYPWSFVAVKGLITVFGIYGILHFDTPVKRLPHRTFQNVLSVLMSAMLLQGWTGLIAGSASVGWTPGVSAVALALVIAVIAYRHRSATIKKSLSRIWEKTKTFVRQPTNQRGLFLFIVGLMLLWISLQYNLIPHAKEFVETQFHGVHLPNIPGRDFWIYMMGPKVLFDEKQNPYGNQIYHDLWNQLVPRAHDEGSEPRLTSGNLMVDIAALLLDVPKPDPGKPEMFGYVASPFNLLLFYPLSKIPYVYAWNAWVAVGLLSLSAVVIFYSWKLFRNETRLNRAGHSLVLVASLVGLSWSVIHSLFYWGQIEPLYLVPLALGIALFSFYPKNTKTLLVASAAISFSIAVKIFPIIVLLFFGYKTLLDGLGRLGDRLLGRNPSRGKFFANPYNVMTVGVLAGTVLLFILTVFVAGWHIFPWWLHKGKSLLLSTMAYNDQRWIPTLHFFLMGVDAWIKGSLGHSLHIPYHEHLTYFYPEIAYGLLLLTLHRIRSRSLKDFLPEVSLLITLLPIVSMHWWDYYNLIMIIPWITTYFYSKEIQSRPLRWLTRFLWLGSIFFMNSAMSHVAHFLPYPYNPGVEHYFDHPEIPNALKALTGFPGVLMLFVAAYLVLTFKKNADSDAGTARSPMSTRPPHPNRAAGPSHLLHQAA